MYAITITVISTAFFFKYGSWRLPEIKLFRAVNNWNHSCLSAGLQNFSSVQPLLDNTTPVLKWSNLGEKGLRFHFRGEQEACTEHILKTEENRWEVLVHVWAGK